MTRGRPEGQSTRPIVKMIKSVGITCRGGPEEGTAKHPLAHDMAYICRRPIEGRVTASIRSVILRPRPPAGQSTCYTEGGLASGLGRVKTVDFRYYFSSDSEDEDAGAGGGDDSANGGLFRVSCNFSDCLTSRESGCASRFQPLHLASEYGTRHMLSNAMLKEYPVPVPNVNKVFCSQWLSHRQVVFGTKCNKLMIYDVNTRHLNEIPSLQSSENSRPLEQETGIHAIEINPSRTFLATTANDTKDIAIYRLPTLDPICVGERGHKDWIFDMTWIDDQFVVSGSRDGTISFWRVTDNLIEEVTSAPIPTYKFIRPVKTKVCKEADRVRSLCYNHRTQEIAVISLNGYIHCWNALRFKQIMTKKLPHTMENVCLATDEDAQMYAVGSKANTDLLDARSLQAIKMIPSRNNGCGIRSVSFKGNILTIGTGIGILLFWDLRAGKFLESTMNSNQAVMLKTSKGWLQSEPEYLEEDDDYLDEEDPAVYTHCFDESGTKLFVAGGPLPSGLQGNYIGLYQ
ncbi:DDB1- and CUL4-associated factor 12 homolog isoform X2 [Tigriopus californicus]|uniref:DDB1- and CUL4-associated factor 12 homolog isoform X2 n=1 Tax=Tigriopus californicus TaxID=6832 RepID=UPI0027D9DF2E|nr:DDB1- and CUL4-associated factor 12 homolog isoform X2 [Tigriopus californicus]